jgi:hypothetical protein
MRLPGRKGPNPRSGRSGPGLDSVRFDTLGLTRQPDPAPTDRYWLGPSLGISLHWFPEPPELPSLEEDELRGLYEALLTGQGEVDGRTPRLLDLAVHRETPVPAVCTLIRGVMPGDDRYSFLSGITLPFATFSWVIKAQCSEGSPTGLREALAFDRFCSEQRLTSQSIEDLTSLFDPYDELWDSDKQDPLTSVRQTQAAILASLEVGPEVSQATPFGS